MPKISVIVPIYNVEPYLRRCVDSILGQTFSDYDLILVDDGSPDNCGSICDEYAAKDARVHVIHQANAGLSAARNSGIDWSFANSDSRWFTFIDSDDWIHRDYLKALYCAAEENDLSVAMCGLHWTDSYIEDASLLDKREFILGVEDAFRQHYAKGISACSKLVKKELYKDIRFPVGKLYEDAFVTHRILFACDKIAVVDENLYYYYYNPTSITRTKWSDRMLHSIEAHEQRLEFFQNKGFRKAHLWEQRIYIGELTNKIQHLVETRESPRDFEDSLRMMQEKLRRALKQARQDKACSMDRELAWSYLYAMRVDWPWKAALAARAVYHKLKK